MYKKISLWISQICHLLQSLTRGSLPRGKRCDSVSTDSCCPTSYFDPTKYGVRTLFSVRLHQATKLYEYSMMHWSTLLLLYCGMWSTLLLFYCGMWPLVWLQVFTELFFFRLLEYLCSRTCSNPALQDPSPGGTDIGADAVSFSTFSY